MAYGPITGMELGVPSRLGCHASGVTPGVEQRRDSLPLVPPCGLVVPWSPGRMCLRPFEHGQGWRWQRTAIDVAIPEISS